VAEEAPEDYLGRRDGSVPAVSVITAIESLLVDIGLAEQEIQAARTKREQQAKQLDSDIANAEKNRPPDPQQPPS